MGEEGLVKMGEDGLNKMGEDGLVKMGEDEVPEADVTRLSASLRGGNGLQTIITVT